MILLFLQKDYLLRPFVLSMAHILPRDPTLKSRPSSLVPRSSGFDYVRDIVHLIILSSKLMMTVEEYHSPHTLTPLKMTARGGAPRANFYLTCDGKFARVVHDKHHTQTIIPSGERTHFCRDRRPRLSVTNTTRKR